MRLNEINDDGNLKKAKRLSNRFSELDGRQPRILITMVGEEGNDLGSKVIATNFADIGFDVDISPSFLSPSNIAREAIENDVHVLAVFFLSGDTNKITLKILYELKKYER